MATTLIGTVCGVALYEDPRYGDEVPLLMNLNGSVLSTCFYELPTEDEMQDYLDTYHSA